MQNSLRDKFFENNKILYLKNDFRFDVSENLAANVLFYYHVMYNLSDEDEMIFSILSNIITTEDNNIVFYGEGYVNCETKDEMESIIKLNKGLTKLNKGIIKIQDFAIDDEKKFRDIKLKILTFFKRRREELNEFLDKIRRDVFDICVSPSNISDWFCYISKKSEVEIYEKKLADVEANIKILKSVKFEEILGIDGAFKFNPHISHCGYICI